MVASCPENLDRFLRSFAHHKYRVLGGGCTSHIQDVEPVYDCGLEENVTPLLMRGEWARTTRVGAITKTTPRNSPGAR